MPITATFTSDWTQFIKGTKDAETALDRFEQETIAAGGAISGLADQSDKATTKAQGIASAYRQFDGALAAAGINLGPAVKGLEDLAAAAGKSVTQIGYLATAGLVVGTFTAAFQSARFVIDKFFPDLDAAIANNVSKWMGWGDVAAQTSAAVADALALASERAGRPITNMNEALRINTQWLEDRKNKAKEAEKADKDAAEAMVRVNAATEDHIARLQTMNPLTVQAAEYALRHGANQRDVASAYNLSASEIAAVVEKVRLHEEGIKKLNLQLDEQKKKQQEAEAAFRAYGDTVGAIVDRIFGVDALKKATAWTTAMETMGVSIERLRTAELEELNATMLAGIDALARSGQLTSQQSSEFARLAIEAQAALAALRPVVTVTEDLVKAQWDYVTALDAEAAAQKASTDAAKQAQAAKGGGGAQAGMYPRAVLTEGGIPRDLFGRPVTPGIGLGNLPMVERPGTAGFYSPAWGQTMSYGPTFNITQPLGSPEAIAQAVGEALTSHYSRGGNRLPV